jgi:hypothetical protein
MAGNAHLKQCDESFHNVLKMVWIVLAKQRNSSDCKVVEEKTHQQYNIDKSPHGACNGIHHYFKIAYPCQESQNSKNMQYAKQS